MRDSRDLLKMQVQRFANQQFIQAAVFLQDERIVEAGNQQDVLHAEGHQMVEALKEAFGIGGTTVLAGGVHQLL